MTLLHLINRQRQVRLALPELKKLALLALPYCLSDVGSGAAVLCSLPKIEITLVSDKAISSIHKKFFKDPSPTDVITFPHGEIIISAETAAANSECFGHSPLIETTLCIIHGLLHLNGYNDLTATQAAKMTKVQNKILKTICRRSEIF